eukprot:3144403-Amphidinium_carterae.1
MILDIMVWSTRIDGVPSFPKMCLQKCLCVNYSCVAPMVCMPYSNIVSLQGCTPQMTKCERADSYTALEAVLNFAGSGKTKN